MTDIPSATLQLLKFPLGELLSNHTEATLKGMQATSCQIEKSNFISVFILLLCVVNIAMM